MHICDTGKKFVKVCMHRGSCVIFIENQMSRSFAQNTLGFCVLAICDSTTMTGDCNLSGLMYVVDFRIRSQDFELGEGTTQNFGKFPTRWSSEKSFYKSEMGCMPPTPPPLPSHWWWISLFDGKIKMWLFASKLWGKWMNSTSGVTCNKNASRPEHPQMLKERLNSLRKS